MLVELGVVGKRLSAVPALERRRVPTQVTVHRRHRVRLESAVGLRAEDSHPDVL